MKALGALLLLVLAATESQAVSIRRVAVIETGINAGPPLLLSREHRFFTVNPERRGMTDIDVETSVLVYDSRTFQVTGRYRKVPGDHACLACDRRSSRLFLGWEIQRRIEAVDSRTGDVQWSVAFPFSSWTLAVSHRHPRLYVRFPDEVHVLDTRTGKTLRKLETNANLAHIPVVEDGWLDRAFVATTRNVLLVLDLADGSVKEMARLGEKPYTDLAPPPALAVDEGRHRLFALQRWPYNRLLTYDTRSLKRIVTAAMPEGVRDLTIDRRTGNAIILALDPPRILFADGASGRILHVETKDVLPEPLSATFDDATGRLFVKSLGTIAVYRFNSAE